MRVPAEGEVNDVNMHNPKTPQIKGSRMKNTAKYTKSKPWKVLFNTEKESHPQSHHIINESLMGYKLTFKDTSDVLVPHCLPSISTRESAHTSWWVRLYSSLISRDNAVVNLWNNFLLLLRNSRVMVFKFFPLMKSHFPSYPRVN